jgi:hypothetical protein
MPWPDLHLTPIKNRGTAAAREPEMNGKGKRMSGHPILPEWPPADQLLVVAIGLSCSIMNRTHLPAVQQEPWSKGELKAWSHGKKGRPVTADFVRFLFSSRTVILLALYASLCSCDI